jgi:hypothetical protein
MYKLAKQTASYKVRGLSHDEALKEILDAIRHTVIPFETIEAESRKDPKYADSYKKLLHIRDTIRNEPGVIVLTLDAI